MADFLLGRRLGPGFRSIPMSGGEVVPLRRRRLQYNLCMQMSIYHTQSKIREHIRNDRQYNQTKSSNRFAPYPPPFYLERWQNYYCLYFAHILGNPQNPVFEGLPCHQDRFLPHSKCLTLLTVVVWVTRSNITHYNLLMSPPRACKNEFLAKFAPRNL